MLPFILMELLLNLAWVLLAVPAIFLWRRSRHAEHRLSSLQCIMALACLLVMLFPVISATDDLVAMRTEMEESPVSKRNVRHASNDKCPTGTRLQNLSALPASLLLSALAAEPDELQLPATFSVPAPPAILAAGRAPPLFPWA